MKKHTIMFLLVFIYIIGIGSYGYYSYLKTEKDIIDGIDEKLKTVAFALPFILDNNYHDNIINDNSISEKKYLENAKKINKYVKDLVL